MTTPRYPEGCGAESQVRGRASSSPNASDTNNAWNVNFNNGNDNWDNKNNTNHVRLVRAGEWTRESCLHPETGISVTLRELYDAWRRARRRKRPSHNQLTFEGRWLDGLLALREALGDGSWRPAPAVCFITTRPKAREIHAPDFADRVVHHWLVPRLETLYEPVFIHDSYSNRLGKGTHAAVERLQSFMRQVRDGSGAGRGWALQLDIRNFFNRIHRPTLYGLLKGRLERARRQGRIDDEAAYALRFLCHRLLARHPAEGVRHRGPAALRRSVPPHKRLANAPAGCGLPIGNLTSQFFANVYLNELDHFVKHQLKCRHYVRYVDDFVCVHESREQLLVWQGQIERFLADRLRLELKDDVRLRPIDAGVDFLGFHCFAHGRRVRRRVVSHCRERLRAWAGRHVRPGGLRCRPAAVARLRSQLASYFGHFAHAGAAGAAARAELAAAYPWLERLFLDPAGGHLHPRTEPAAVCSYAGQLRWFRRHYPELRWLVVQRGNRAWLHDTAESPSAEPLLRLPWPAHGALLLGLTAQGRPWGLVAEHGWLRSGMRRRVLVASQPCRVTATPNPTYDGSGYTPFALSLSKGECGEPPFMVRQAHHERLLGRGEVVGRSG
jgi:retron-type reverse transcriptase